MGIDDGRDIKVAEQEGEMVGLQIQLGRMMTEIEADKEFLQSQDQPNYYEEVVKPYFEQATAVSGGDRNSMIENLRKAVDFAKQLQDYINKVKPSVGKEAKQGEPVSVTEKIRKVREEVGVNLEHLKGVRNMLSEESGKRKGRERIKVMELLGMLNKKIDDVGERVSIADV